MKKILTPFIFALAAASALAQGTVNFWNNSSNFLISTGSQPLPAGSPGSYYFALLTAPLGTTNPVQFTFSGLYATNLSVVGTIFGGNFRTVAGWVPGSSRSFMVAGWSANAGHDWNPAWLQPSSNPFPPDAFFALSMIGRGLAGGIDPGTGVPVPLPPLNIFGAPPSINRGFSFIPGFDVIPEPGSAILGVLAGLCICLARRKSARNVSQDVPIHAAQIQQSKP